MASTAWYRTGTIALVQNSATVTGTGTQWNSPVYGVAPGQMLLVPGAGTVVMYEIQRVVSDTQITLATPYTGSAATGQQYAIVTALVGSVADFSRQLSVLVNQWQSQLDGWQQILSGTGDVKLTAPDGSTVTVKSQAALTAAINDTLNKTTTTTQTVASAVEFKKNITSNGDQQMRATSTTPNLLLRFRDVNDVEKGAIFSDTSTGNMTIRWNGQTRTMVCNADGAVTFPGAINIGTTPVLKTGDHGLGAATQRNTAGINLDTANLPVGFYSGNNWTGTMPPGVNLSVSTSWGYLIVENLASDGTNYIKQTLGVYGVSSATSRFFMRYRANGVWYPWCELWHTGNLPTPLKPGDYGLGAASTPTVTDLGAQQTNQWWHANNITTTPTTGTWAGIMGGYDSISRWNLAFLQGGTTVDLRAQVVKNGVGGTWVSTWHSGNTTVDSNGFIKKASPIIRLSNDPEKMAADYLSGFTLAGVGAVNGEAAGVSAQRLATGIYQITGSLGLATEGWQIEIPQDTNGNRLVFASTEVDEDGTIRVYTHKRRFDPESAMVVAGEPMDIPEGRWIDLRLSMPAQPEPEIVEPEEVQPESEVDAESTTDNNAE